MFGKSTDAVRLVQVVMQKLRDIYPEKAAANIAARTGVSTRAAEFWMSNSRIMGADHMLALLISENGGELIAAVMKTLPEKRRPAWWRKQDMATRMAALEKQQAEHEAQMRQLRLELMD